MNAQYVHETIAPQRQALLRHPLYRKIRSIEDLHGFLEIHVFAVWDFMSLLKGLQQKLTCTDWPWFATEHPQTRYFVNEIVLGEESDLAADGRRLSHFEMYLEAMTACGADTSEIRDFIGQVRSLEIVGFNLRARSRLFNSFTTPACVSPGTVRRSTTMAHCAGTMFG